MASNIILINRGDSLSLNLVIYDSNAEEGRYILKDEDVLYLGVMLPHQPFEDGIIRKRYTKDDCDESGTITVTLTPDDTINLVPGTYYYVVKLHKKSEEFHVDEVITVIDKTKFIILS